MPRARRPWFRFYVEATGDLKVRALSPTHRWLWVAVLSAARESPVPGKLMLSCDIAVNELMLSDYAAVRLQDVRAGLKSLQALGLIERDARLGCWYVPRWSERQFESDDVTERTAKHRSQERGRNVPTLFLGTGNSVTETETEKEEELEEELSAKPKAKRRTAAPITFDLTEAHRQWASERGLVLDLEAETEHFLDHHRAKGSLMLDWDSAWRTWMRNSVRFRSSTAARPPVADRTRDRIRAAADEARAAELALTTGGAR